MTQLYKLTGEWAALQARAEDGEDVSAELAQLSDSLEVKAERIVAVLRNIRSDQDALRAEEKRLADRRRALENNEERLREYIRANMEIAGIQRIKCASFTMSLAERERVVVYDEKALPEEFTRTKVEPDRGAIQAAYKQDGEVPPGVRIETYNSLTIK